MKNIGELQHEFLTNLLKINKHITVKQALHRCYVLNQYMAVYSLATKQ
jgi:hypothetical protein